jgi:hypothetical protein
LIKRGHARGADRHADGQLPHVAHQIAHLGEEAVEVLGQVADLIDGHRLDLARQVGIAFADFGEQTRDREHRPHDEKAQICDHRDHRDECDGLDADEPCPAGLGRAAKIPYASSARELDQVHEYESIPTAFG